MHRKAFTIIEIIMIPVVILVLSLFVRWIANIIQITHSVSDPITGIFIIKCIGVIVAHLGGVLGIIGMF